MFIYPSVSQRLPLVDERHTADIPDHREENVKFLGHPDSSSLASFQVLVLQASDPSLLARRGAAEQ